MADKFQEWKEQQFAEEDQVSSESPGESETSLGFRIFEYGSLLFLYGCYFAFCWWQVAGLHAGMLEIEAGTADPKMLRGYGKLLVFMTEQFGVWPSSLIFFGAMQIPIGVMCWQVWRPKQAEDASEHLPASEPWIPRFEDRTAKKILMVLLVLFHAAAAAILFELLPVAVCAFILAATVFVAVALKVHQGRFYTEDA